MKPPKRSERKTDGREEKVARKMYWNKRKEDSVAKQIEEQQTRKCAPGNKFHHQLPSKKPIAHFKFQSWLMFSPYTQIVFPSSKTDYHRIYKQLRGRNAISASF